MASNAKGLIPRSKFVTAYEKLFEGLTPQVISPHEDPAQFWSNVLSLDVDRPWLGQKLRDLSKNDLLTTHKPFLNTLISVSLYHFRNATFNDSRKTNAVATLTLVIQHCLTKNLTGWEVMEVFAGGVEVSDSVFLDLMDNMDMVLVDTQAPAAIKHQVLQLLITFACSIGQASPGAYLLRRDLYPGIRSIIRSPQTQEYAFEASLVLSILANFHRSDAAKLNPYITSIRRMESKEILSKICVSSNKVLRRVVESYQRIADDSPTFTMSVGSFLSSLRPDRALSSTPVDHPRELFKDQPITEAVALMPVLELLILNPHFPTVVVEQLLLPNEMQLSNDTGPPFPHTILSASSYILTHASSVSSPRAIVYARLALNVLLRFSEHEIVMSVFLRPSKHNVRICRQRQPPLPLPAASRPLLGALLDCCLLWLRHNLHKRLEVTAYITCTRVIQRVVWFLLQGKYRLDYYWEEVWRALLNLLDFISNKIEGLDELSGTLFGELIILINYALYNSEAFLSTPQTVYQLVYEVVRASPSFERHESVLKSLLQSGVTRSVKGVHLLNAASEALQSIRDVASHYKGKVDASKPSNAADVIHVIAKDVDRDGLFGARDSVEDDAERQVEELVEPGFIRFGCQDGLKLVCT